MTLNAPMTPKRPSSASVRERRKSERGRTERERGRTERGRKGRKRRKRRRMLGKNWLLPPWHSLDQLALLLPPLSQSLIILLTVRNIQYFLRTDWQVYLDRWFFLHLFLLDSENGFDHSSRRYHFLLKNKKGRYEKINGKIFFKLVYSLWPMWAQIY